FGGVGLDFLQELLAGQDAVGEVVVHPVEVLPPAVDDAARVPRGDVLLGRVLGHERRVDLVDVVEAHDHVVLDPLRLGGLLCGKPEADHSPSSSYAWSSRYLPGFMMLFGSSDR